MSEQNAYGADIPTEVDGGIKIKYIIKRYYKEMEAKIEYMGNRA
jgi:hypothetical protein